MQDCVPEFARASDEAAARQRWESLARLLPLWPHQIEDTSRAGRARMIAVLKRALRAERQRGLCGHWTYDLARHAQLLEAYRQEVRAFDAEAGSRAAPDQLPL